MTALFRVLSCLPLWLLHGMGWVMGWLVFGVSSSYRQRFLAHARQAGVRPGQFLHAVGQAGQMVAELPRLWLGRAVSVSFTGDHHIEAALALGRGIVFLTPHLGCFEVTAQAYAQRFGSRQPMTVLFRPARKAGLRSLLATARHRPGLMAVPTNLAGVKQLIKALRQGQSVGLLPDQVPPAGLGVWASFFDRPAYTMTLSARLAQQTGAIPLLAWGERLSWGRGYVVHITALEETLPDTSEAAAACINRAMEGLIRQCPQQYLWAYARYKQPRQEPQ